MFIELQWVSHLVLHFNYFLLTIISPAVLHTCHKIAYFKNSGWEKTWIETLQDIVHAEFDQSYAFMDVVETKKFEAPRNLVCIS